MSDFFPAAEILLNETVKRLEALSTRDSFVGNLERILTPLMEMNIHRYIGRSTWRLLPSSLNSPAILDRVDDLQKAFFSSATPQDFYTAITTSTLTNVDKYSPMFLGNLADFVISYGDGGTTLPEFLTRDQREDDTKPVIDVIIYDIDGTLLSYNGEYDLNMHVYNQLMADIAAGENIEIRTGGPVDEQQIRLDTAFKKAGVVNPGIKVQSKHDLIDKKVKKLIDDTAPYKQKFRAATWIHPDSLKKAAMTAAPELKQP